MSAIILTWIHFKTFYKPYYFRRMKFKSLWKAFACASLAVIAAVGCNPDEKTDPIQLGTPVPTIKTLEPAAFTVAWEAVDKADSYTYQLDNQEAVTTENLEVSFTEMAAGTYSFKVQATSKDAAYLASEWATLSISVAAQPVFSVVMEEVGQTSFTAVVTAEHVMDFAYVVATEGTYENPAEIYADGTVVTCEDGETPVTVEGLSFNTAYVAYFAARVAENQYVAEIPTLEFTTLDSESDVAVYDIDYREFKVRVRVPESAKEAGNVIRWGFSDLATYNMNKESFFGYTTDAEFLNNNSEVYPSYFFNDTTFIANEENSLIRDANGDPIFDEYEGAYMTYYDPIVPGQPEVILFGEFGWGESDYGWGQGWYEWMFDYEGFLEDYSNGGVQPRQMAYDETSYWSGFYHNEVITLKQPTVLDASLNYDDSGLTPKGGFVTFDPDPEVLQYCVLVLDSYTLYAILPYLNDNEDLLQWYTTSYNAAYMNGAMSLRGPVQLNLLDFFWEMYPEDTYYILAVGMGDENGTSQCFEMHTIKLPEPTEPAPSVVVTPIENTDDPYHVWFNVKAPNKDVAYAVYAANYIRDWENELQWSGYNDLIDAYGSELSEAEIEMINSDEGLNMSFTSLPNYTTRLVVGAENWEGTMEDLDAEGCQAIADNTTPRLPAKERVESSLFTDLEGEWTATATVLIKEYDYEIWDYVTYEETIQSKVVIGNPYYPETLTEEVYAVYEDNGISREATDALYENFKQESQLFEEDVRNQNRMVCLGFDFAATWEGQLTSATPYELFTMSDYGAYNNAALFYDFGQKWYLEVDENGNVTAPFNSERLYPMSNWNYYYPFFMAGIAEDWSATTFGPASEEDAWPAFPVEVSADKNTLTMKPCNWYDIDIYPNVAYDNYGVSIMDYQVISDVVLTRGWEGNDAEATAAVPARQQQAAKVVLPNRPYARASFLGKKPVEFQQVDYHFVNLEKFKENKESYLKMIRGQK